MDKRTVIAVNNTANKFFSFICNFNQSISGSNVMVQAFAIQNGTASIDQESYAVGKNCSIYFLQP